MNVADAFLRLAFQLDEDFEDDFIDADGKSHTIYFNKSVAKKLARGL